MKYFIALELPEDLKAQVFALQDKLRELITRQGVRFTPTERLHVVLIESHDPIEIPANLTASGVQISGFGAWPTNERPGIIGVKVAIDGTGMPESPRIVLARISPASQKVGVACRSLFAAGFESITGPATEIASYRQLPTGEVERLS